MAAVPSMTIPVEVELSGHVVRPGDTLIILCKGQVSEHLADTIKERTKASIPGLGDVVVIKADGLAVYRPDLDSGDDEHTG